MPHLTFGELCVIIPLITANLVLIINAFKTREVKAAVAEIKGELVTRDDVANGKLDQIHTLTNSNMAAVQEKLKNALDRIDRLEELLVKATTKGAA